MATSDVLFPSDFERLYNLPFQWADSGLRHAHLSQQSHPAIRETDPDRIQRLSEEIGKAMHRSLRHKQERAMASGGDLMTREGQELGRRLVKKRGEEFASRQTGSPAVPSVPSAEVPFTESETLANEIENAITSMLNIISTGAITGELYTQASKIQSILVQKGDILTKGQLDSIYSTLTDLIQSLPPLTANYLKKEQVQVLGAVAIQLDATRRAIQFLQKYVTKQPRERKLAMRTLRSSITKFLKERTREPVSARRLFGPGQAGVQAAQRDALRDVLGLRGELESGLVPSGPLPVIPQNPQGPPPRPPRARVIRRLRLPVQQGDQ